MTSAAQHQAHLTQKLWLLRKLHFSERISGDPTDYVPQAILDAVALYLTTGHPDGHLAAFYAASRSRLFLAKTGQVSSEDDAVVTALVAEMREAKTFRDLLPFLARRSAAYVNKRIQKLRHGLHRHFYHLHAEAKKLSDPRLAKALEGCRDSLAFNVPFSDEEEACRHFGDLVLASHTVTRLFESFAPSSCRVVSLDAIRHAFDKVSQYANAQRLLIFWKRYGTCICVVWVPDMHPEVASHAINTTTIGERVDDIIPQNEGPREQEVKDTMLNNMDRLYAGWRDPSSVAFTLRVHPEIRLILYLITNRIDDVQISTAELALGCSQRICLCCSLWIAAFNACTGMNWVTSTGNGHPRYDWAFPDAPKIAPMGFGFDVDILQHVTDRVKGVLYKLWNNTMEQLDDEKVVTLHLEAMGNEEDCELSL